jgi:hypothetical protein
MACLRSKRVEDDLGDDWHGDQKDSRDDVADQAERVFQSRVHGVVSFFQMTDLPAVLRKSTALRKKNRIALDLSNPYGAPAFSTASNKFLEMSTVTLMSLNADFLTDFVFFMVVE